MLTQLLRRVGRAAQDLPQDTKARLASQGSDAFRYCAMSWREPVESERELTPLERLRQEIARPKTYNELWKMRADSLREQDIEVDEHEDLFNLSENTTISLE